MSRIQRALASPARPDRFVCLVTAARNAADAIGAVDEYLAAWSIEKIARVQKVDGGWAPFDENRNPIPLLRPSELRKACDAVHRQCSALRAAGLPLAPELLELDLFLFFACTKLAELEAGTCG